MIGTSLVLLAALALGIFLYLAIRPPARGAELIGGGFLSGIGAMALILFFLTILGVPWNRFSVINLAVALLFISIAMVRPTAEVWKSLLVRATPAVLVIDLMTVAVLIGYAMFATAGPLPEFDFLTNWGLKGRLFWEHQGIDWAYLESAWDRHIHSDYPPLLPLMFDVVAVLTGRWDDRSIGLLFAAFGGAALLMIRSALPRETDWPVLPALATLALASFAVAPWVGLAEGPLVAYGTAALLLIREALRAGDHTALRAAAVFLGFAGLLKNEGIALIVAATIALAVVGRRMAVAMWPAFALAASWQILRAVHHFPTDLAIGDVWSRILAHAGEPLTFLQAIASHTVGKPLFWAGLAVAFLLQLREAVQREKFILLVIAIQFLFYLFAYSTSPFQMDWHIKWSWERLVYHLTLPLATVALALIFPLVDFRRSRSVT